LLIKEEERKKTEIGWVGVDWINLRVVAAGRLL
jgi:hypothetical protein